MKWIKVKDCFPEEDKKVLGIWAQGTYGAEIISIYWSKEKGWYSHDLPLSPISPSFMCIIYWIEFPEVPEKWWE